MAVREQIGKAFGLSTTITEELDVINIGAYCDSLIDRQFEKLPLHYPFTPDEIQNCNDVNKWRQLDQFSALARKRFMSHLLSKPASIMNDYIELDKLSDSPQFLFYSGHDSTIAPLWEFVDR